MQITNVSVPAWIAPDSNRNRRLLRPSQSRPARKDRPRQYAERRLDPVTTPVVTPRKVLDEPPTLADVRRPALLPCQALALLDRPPLGRADDFWEDESFDRLADDV